MDALVAAVCACPRAVSAAVLAVWAALADCPAAVWLAAALDAEEEAAMAAAWAEVWDVTSRTVKERTVRGLSAVMLFRTKTPTHSAPFRRNAATPPGGGVSPMMKTAR